jgi:hypothetical protein
MSFNTNPTNFKEFKSYVQKYGFALSNFYDVQFYLNNESESSQLLKNIFNLGMTSNTNTTSPSFMEGLLRLYADECSIPGYSISTGDYRITNSPTMKYAYGIVNNEITISFILDADAQVRRIFDAWGNYIYGSVSLSSGNVTNTNINFNTKIDIGRTRYRDDYVADIIVAKLERNASSKKNTRTKFTNIDAQKNFYNADDIIPDYDGPPLLSGFGKPFYTYSVRLRNCFPTTISSIPLSSGSSELVRVQVTFEYELAVPSSQTSNGSVQESSNWLQITN